MTNKAQQTASLPALTRRSFHTLALAAAAGMSAHGAFAAEAWPNKTLRIIVPFAPGGAADSSARVLAEILAPQLGQAVIVENRPGAGSAIGVVAAAQSRDGHTLLMGSNSMVINPILNPALAYDVARDFDAVGMVSAQPLVLVVASASKIHTVADLISQAKAAPGQLSAGNSGTGTLAHLTSVLFELQSGVDLISVPYKGESALMPDLISGQVSLGFLNLPSVMPHIRSGRLRAIAVSAPQPIVELPGIATFRSLNLAALEVQGWAALLAPKGAIPPEGLSRLESLLAKALASDTVKTRFAALSVTPLTASREATAAHLRQEAARWQQVISARGIRVDG
jgi:tripartite-type tricarboxylate transporter receptor subunit TctC